MGAADYLMCKIDIEGSEYDVLPQMMADGTLCLCDRLSVEWHAWLGNKNFNSLPLEDWPSKGPGEQKCLIPHLRKEIPYFNCYMPRLVAEARSKCHNASRLEKWF